MTMPGFDGYISWDRTVLPPNGRIWLEGRTWDNWLETSAGELRAGRTEPLVALTMAAGNHVVQGYARSADLPIVGPAYAYQTAFLADSEDDYYSFLRLEALGRPVQFFPADPVVDIFHATSGQSYSLNRPLADGVVSGFDSELYPMEIRIDDSVDPSAASVSGQAVTANASGLLAVTYYPVFRVKIDGVSRTFSDTNRLIVSMTLTEVISFP